MDISIDFDGAIKQLRTGADPSRMVKQTTQRATRGRQARQAKARILVAQIAQACRKN